MLRTHDALFTADGFAKKGQSTVLAEDLQSDF